MSHTFVVYGHSDSGCSCGKAWPCPTLDAAWEEAKETLPDGWLGPSIWQEPSYKWAAYAVEHSILRPMPVVVKGRASPTAALRALVAALRDREIAP